MDLYKVGQRHQRAETWSAANPDGRWRANSLANSDNLPAPAVIVQEIVEDLQAALEQFKLIAGDLDSTPFEAEIIQH